MELSDLCGNVIEPMLKLAGLDFEYAVEVGISRKQQKMKEAKDKPKE